MPYLPPFPDHLVTIFDAEYWTTNWAGALLGIMLGGLSAWSIVKKERNADKNKRGFPLDHSPEDPKR